MGSVQESRSRRHIAPSLQDSAESANGMMCRRTWPHGGRRFGFGLQLAIVVATLLQASGARAVPSSQPQAKVRPIIEVLAPAAGETRMLGVAGPVRWRFEGFSPRRKLRIALSTDGGATWRALSKVKAARRTWSWAPDGMLRGAVAQAMLKICLPRQGKRSVCGQTLSPFLLGEQPVSDPTGLEAPIISNPGEQTSRLGDAVRLPIKARSGSQRALNFSASGLPIGLSINQRTGLISGYPTAVGRLNVSVSATDTRGQSATVEFPWTIERLAATDSPIKLSAMSSPPRTAGEAITYTAVAGGGADLQFSWLFGDGTAQTQASAAPSATHRFQRPGRFVVSVMAHQNGQIVAIQQFVQAIHLPVVDGRPQSSTSILFESPSGRVWNVNPDRGTVTAYDTVARSTVAEIEVGADPRSLALAPDGRLWVVNRRSANISIIDGSTMAVVETVPLPFASQPFGLVFDPKSHHGYVSLEGMGQVLELDTLSAGETGRVAVGAGPRHLSMDAKGTRLFVSRFVTPPLPGESGAQVRTVDANGKPVGGEVVVVDSATMSIEKTVVLQHNDTPDNPSGGRGVPNYLGAPVVSPDGRSAWVPSKQDNIMRGKLRDGLDLTFHWTTRSIASRIDLDTLSEDFPSRLDFRNSGLANAALFDPGGNYLFVVQETSREVAVVDAYGVQELFRIDTGLAPNGLALSDDGRLFVHNFMERSVSIYDVGGLIQAGTLDVPRVGEYRTVAAESLSPTVLRGKQLFYDARDPRLARDGFLSCGACHSDGGQDGRTWDFTGFGEGLRNTTTLEGRAGTGHGRMHWTGNFDEVQDFEGQIRRFAGGTGLMSDEDFNGGSRSQSLGDPKAGLSADLDALAAYLESLREFAPSPHRTVDGGLTPVAETGKALFQSRKCDQCHGGGALTDSINAAENPLHDIGTIRQPESGQRLNGPLIGFDTPSLRGIWNSAPYLHDGSATSMAEAVRAHGSEAAGGALSDEELAALTAFLQELDGRDP